MNLFGDLCVGFGLEFVMSVKNYLHSKNSSEVIGRCRERFPLFPVGKLAVALVKSAELHLYSIRVAEI